MPRKTVKKSTKKPPVKTARKAASRTAAAKKTLTRPAKRARKAVTPAASAPDALIGARAPAFRLSRDGGGTVALGDYAGRKLVIFFYPKANTPAAPARRSTSPALPRNSPRPQRR
jgi:peroxiredoxin Q/BCP